MRTIKNKYLAFNDNTFKRYFKTNNWTFDIYEQYVNNSLFGTNDLRHNSVYPKRRSLERYLGEGRIPIEAAIQLCQLFDCKPKEIGISLQDN